MDHSAGPHPDPANQVWFGEALRRFGAHRGDIFGSEELCTFTVRTPRNLWFNLKDVFSSAYESSPRGEADIAAIYAYADWCLCQPQAETNDEDDLPSIVMVSFYEYIPTLEPAMLDMLRWFDLSEVEFMHQTFSYLIGPEKFQRLLALYRTPSKE